MDKYRSSLTLLLTSLFSRLSKVSFAVIASCCLLFTAGADEDEADTWNAREALQQLDLNLPTPRYKRLWRVRFASPEFTPVRVVIAADGSHVMACDELAARVFDATTGRLVGKLQERLSSKITCAALCRTGELAIVGLEQGGVLVWKTATGEVQFERDAPSASVLAAAISSDSERVVFVDSKLTYHRYDLSSGAGKWWRFDSVGKFSNSSAGAINSYGDQWAFRTADGKAHLLSHDEGKPKLFPLEGFEGLHAATMSRQFLSAIGYSGELQMAKPASNSGSRSVGYAQLPSVKRVVISDDEQQLRLVSGGWLDIRSMRCPPFRVLIDCHSSALRSALHADIAATQLRLASLSGDDLEVGEIAPFPDSPAWRFGALVHDLAVNEQFERLDALGQFLQHDPEPFLWNGSQTKYETLLLVLGYQPSPIESQLALGGKLLKHWLAKRPASMLARILEAQCLVDRGWWYRGGDTADKVPKEAWSKFHDFLERAETKLQPVWQQGDIPPEAYQVLVSIAKGEGWSKARLQPHIDNFLLQDAAYFSPHLVMVERLMERWGGRPLDAVNYADGIAKRVGGDKGEFLYARMAFRLYPYFDAKEVWKESGFDYERTVKACLKRIEQEPRDVFAASRGLQIAYHQKDEPRRKAFRDHLAKQGLTPQANYIFSAAEAWEAAKP